MEYFSLSTNGLSGWETISALLEWYLVFSTEPGKAMSDVCVEIFNATRVRFSCGNAEAFEVYKSVMSCEHAHIFVPFVPQAKL